MGDVTYNLTPKKLLKDAHFPRELHQEEDKDEEALVEEGTVHAIKWVLMDNEG